MSKIKFDIREVKEAALENNEMLFRTDTLMDLGLKNRSLKIVCDGGKKIVLKCISLESEDEKLEKNVGYVNAHVYARASGNKVSPDLIEPITLGADPEFFLVNTANRKAFSFWAITQTSRIIKEYSREIGMDVAGFIGEFRPRPGKTEAELTKNLKTLIDRTYEYIGKAVKFEKLTEPKNNWRIHAHSYEYDRPAGFHIHLGLPNRVLSNRKLISSLVRSLDYFVGIPCMRIDKQYMRRVRMPGKRRTGTYGGPSAFKRTGITLEYRMPGGYHLRHPELTEALIGTALMVSEDFSIRTKTLNRDSILEEIIYRMPPYSELKNIFRKVEDDRLEEWFGDISDKFRRMCTFRKHSKAVENFISFAKQGPDLNEDIFANWR